MGFFTLYYFFTKVALLYFLLAVYRLHPILADECFVYKQVKLIGTCFLTEKAYNTIPVVNLLIYAYFVILLGTVFDGFD